MVEQSHDITEVVIKSVPPLVLTVWSFLGFTLQEWAALAAIIYTSLMIFFLLVDRYKKWTKERKR